MGKESKEISKEIEQIAEKMVKSVSDGKQALFDTIKNLGADGLRKALPTLSPEQQALVHEALEEMSKAANKPEPSEDAKKKTPPHTDTKNAKLRTESLSGSDDEDEKRLMDEKNADVDHQGGPKDKPEGYEGQVIKSEDLEKAKETPHKGPHGGIIIGHTRDGKNIYQHADHEGHAEFSPQDHKDAHDAHMNISAPIRAKMHGPIDPQDSRSKEDRDRDHMEMYHQARMHEHNAREHMAMGAKKEHEEMKKNYGTAMKSYENFMTKAEKIEKKQGVPEGVDPEKWERGVKEVKKKPGIDNPYAVVNAAMAKGDDMKKNEMCPPGEMPSAEKLEKKKMKKAKKMAKALKKIVKMAKSLGLSKEEVKKAIEAAGGDLKVVKSEMKAKMNKEENQVEIKTQDKAAVSAPKPDQSKGDLEIKPDETADEALKKLPKVEKSLNEKTLKWSPKNPIAAGSLGRNTHWDVDAFIEKSEAEKQEAIKKGGYLNEKEVAEELKKSEDPSKKLDINDMLEKGYDKYSSEEIARIEGIKNHKPDQGAVRKSNYDVEIARSMGMTKEEYEKIFGSNE